MPNITVQWYAGRTDQQKRDITAAITKAMVEIGKTTADQVLSKMGVKDPLLDIAKRLEEAALKDPYFVERKLYPNVDFYSGIIYKALGIPVDMFTVFFAIP